MVMVVVMVVMVMVVVMVVVAMMVVMVVVSKLKLLSEERGRGGAVREHLTQLEYSH